MAVAAGSTTEAVLENQRLGGLQLRVATLCALVQMCDGYDVNSVAWAVPSLIRDWHLPPSTFAIAFLWSSIGIMVGALSAGPIGDRFGRRPLLLASLAIFGVASLLTAVVGSLSMLSLLRFFTGIGIGGGFSGAAALTGDYTPHRLRATMIMATFTGAPLGGFLGGSDRSVATRGMGLAHDLRTGRYIPVGSVAGFGALAAGIAAISGNRAEAISAQRRAAATSRHHFGAERCR
jgi:MFS transporter, AAHS family, 4-hydroxybenzoate transporter